MITLSPDALLARLTALPRGSGPGGVVAFDADGTLWSGDVTRDLVAFVMAERPLRADGLDRLRGIAQAHGVPLGRDPYDQLALLVLAYSAGKLESAAAVESVAVAFAGLEATRFDELVADAIERAGLRERFRAPMARLFEWAHAEGLPVVVVSASPRLAVSHALDAVGLRASSVLGAELAVAEGRVLPVLARPVLVDRVKVEALRAHTALPVRAAFGDDLRDVPLLGLAEVPVLVRPTEELRRAAAALADAVELVIE